MRSLLLSSLYPLMCLSSIVFNMWCLSSQNVNVSSLCLVGFRSRSGSHPFYIRSRLSWHLTSLAGFCPFVNCTHLLIRFKKKKILKHNLVISKCYKYSNKQTKANKIVWFSTNKHQTGWMQCHKTPQHFKLFIVAFWRGVGGPFWGVLVAFNNHFCQVWSGGTWQNKHDVRYKQWHNFNDLMSQRPQPHESFHVVHSSVFSCSKAESLKKDPLFGFCTLIGPQLPLGMCHRLLTSANRCHSLALVTSIYYGGGRELPSQHNFGHYC